MSVYIRPIRHSVRTAPVPAGNNLIYRARAKRVNVSMSYRGTLNLLEKLCNDYDGKVTLWAAEVRNKILLPQSEVKF